MENMTEAKMMYQISKLMNPMDTKLDKDWRTIIKETDSQFMNDYDFFKMKAPFAENKTVDNVLDWLYGHRMFSTNMQEQKRISKVINALERHIVI